MSDSPGSQQPHDPGAWVPRSGTLIGGRYRVVARIGSGGMAEVLRAHDEVLGRDVAVKVFRNHSAQRDTALGLERQRAELNALAALNHPNLITLYDGIVTSTDAYLVLELIDGPSLAERLERGPLPEPQVRSLAVQIADALAYVHALNMVHRDVKPANILLGRDVSTTDDTPRARLSDFGIVRFAGTEHLTSLNLTVGSAPYLSPEQARGIEVGPASDIYSLGLVVMEAFTGSRPFEGSALEMMTARVSRGPAIPAPLPEPWPALLRDMTAMNPADRPTAVDVAITLRSGYLQPYAPIPDVGPTDATALLVTAPGGRGSGIAASAAIPAAVGLAGAVPRVEAAEHGRPSRRHLGLIAAALAVVCIVGAALLLVSPGFSGSPTSPTSPHPSPNAFESSSQTSSSAAVLQAGATRTTPRASPSTRSAKSARPSPGTKTRPVQTAPPATTRAAPATTAPPSTAAGAPSTSSTPPSPSTTSSPGSSAPASP